MKELNKNILNDAINNLPRHKVPNECWFLTEKEIRKVNAEKNRDILKAAISNLPEYKARETIWNGVEKELNRSLDIKSKTNRLIYNISKIAAVFIILDVLSIVALVICICL